VGRGKREEKIENSGRGRGRGSEREERGTIDST
jgi:hypothetical protein